MRAVPTTRWIGRGSVPVGGVARRCRAMVVAGETIVWTGTDPAEAPPTDRTVDLGAAWFQPAFVDAHVHATATGLLEGGLDLSGATSAADVLAAIRARARQAPAGQAVIYGARWDDHGWPEGRPPTADQLAAAAEGSPVLLWRVDAHSCLVDRGTLDALDLPPGALRRDADGRPTGWLTEEHTGIAWRRVRERMPAAQLTAARDQACRSALALGIGSIHEMGLPSISGRADTDVWAAGDWPLDVQTWWGALDPDPGPGLRPGGDLFLDGSIGSGTAATAAPYRGPDGRPGTGVLFHDDDAVAAFFTACTARRVGGGVHAIGDRAVDQALRGLEAAADRHGWDAVRACRHRIEHLEVLTGDHVERLARAGVVASVQPVFDALWGGADRMYAHRFGAEQACRTNPFADLTAAGVPLAFGSDSTVTPLGPWAAVHAAERHRGGRGVDRLTAITAHTLGGRLAAGQDDVGPLRPGSRADLVAWPADPLEVDDPTPLRPVAVVIRGRDVTPEVPA